MILKNNKTLFIAFLINLFSIAENVSLFSQPFSEAKSNDIAMVVELPTVEIRGRNVEERFVLGQLALTISKEYADILYLDRLLDNIQVEYKIPAPLIWAIICLESEKLNSGFSNKTPTISTEFKQVIYEFHQQEVDKYDFQAIGNSLEEIAEYIHEILMNKDCQDCDLADYECWIESLLPRYNTDGEIIANGWDTDKGWAQKIQDILKEKDLYVLIR